MKEKKKEKNKENTNGFAGCIREKLLFRAIMEHSVDSIYFKDKDSRFILVNRQKAAKQGVTQPELLKGKSDRDFMSGQEAAERKQGEEEILRTGVPIINAQEKLTRWNGAVEWVSSSKYPLYNEAGEIIGIWGISRDITERKRLEELLFLEKERYRQLCLRDPLTDIGNRRFFETELERLDSPENYPLSIIVGDVNGLKMLNDSLGHGMGDRLLMQAVDIMREESRETDVLSRTGGDEFVMLMARTGANEAALRIERIRTALRGAKTGGFELSIAFGFGTKSREDEEIAEVFKSAEDMMYNTKLYESPSVRGKALDHILKAIYEKNQREQAHSERVSRLCEAFGEALEMDEADVRNLKVLGLCHDIGKIAVSDEILAKGKALTRQEQRELLRHAETGYRILSAVRGMSDVAVCVLSHHERWDGKGYPKGLAGEEIPLFARIVSIADAYDTMSRRNQHPIMSIEEIIREFREHAGTQFDPGLVKIFLEKVLAGV